jgi:hypothetical protein
MLEATKCHILINSKEGSRVFQGAISVFRG